MKSDGGLGGLYMALHPRSGGLVGLEVVVWWCGVCGEGGCNGGEWWVKGGSKELERGSWCLL